MEPDSQFENRLKKLSPGPAGDALKARIASAIKEKEKKRKAARHAAVSFLWLAGAAAGFFFLFHLTSLDGNHFELGRQEILVHRAEPEMVQFPNSAPMWKIQYHTLQKDFYETSAGIVETHFTPRVCSVYSPVFYQ